MAIHRGPWGPAFLKQPTGGGGGPLPLLWSFENEPGGLPISVPDGSGTLPVEDNNGGTYNGNDFDIAPPGTTIDNVEIVNDNPSPAGERYLRSLDSFIGPMLDPIRSLRLGGSGPGTPISLPPLSEMSIDFYMRVINLDGSEVDDGFAGISLEGMPGSPPIVSVDLDVSNFGNSSIDIFDGVWPPTVINSATSAEWNTWFTTIGTVNPGEWADGNWHRHTIDLTETTVQATYDGAITSPEGGCPNILVGLSFWVAPFYKLGTGPYYACFDNILVTGS